MFAYRGPVGAVLYSWVALSSSIILFFTTSSWGGVLELRGAEVGEGGVNTLYSLLNISCLRFLLLFSFLFPPFVPPAASWSGVKREGKATIVRHFRRIAHGIRKRQKKCWYRTWIWEKEVNFKRNEIIFFSGQYQKLLHKSLLNYYFQPMYLYTQKQLNSKRIYSQ